MKKAIKLPVFSFLAIILIIAGIMGYYKIILPSVGAPENITVEKTPARIERGSYLANSVCGCMDCHSARDWNKYAGPIVEGTLGKGGEEFNKNEGLPGKFFAKNLTPASLKDWSDGEILRAISSGVDRDGNALYSIMPHKNYGQMDREDIYSIITYLRTLSAVENNVPDSKPDFPLSVTISTIPEKAHYSTIPPESDKVAYGKYLVNAANCAYCHTPHFDGKPVEGMAFAGGFDFTLKTGGVVHSANITPDGETGIGEWAEDDFVSLFTPYADSSFVPPSVNPGDYNTVMPWLTYSKMKPEDLAAIYTYLKTVPAVKNNVTKFTSE